MGSTKIEEIKNAQCSLGHVLFRECSYVQESQRVLKITELQDAREMKEAGAKRIEEQTRIEEVKKSLREKIAQARGLQETIKKEREAFLSHARNEKNLLRDLEQTWEALERWTQKLDRLSGFQELDALHKRLDSVESEIISTEDQLAIIVKQHDDNRKLLQSIFSGIVHSVLSSQHYDGEVAIEKRELSFRITHGQAMTGEAVETLSVLLADICCMIYCTLTDSAHMPGLLVHDSPREADLGGNIYRNFIRLAAKLQEHFATQDECPFQYVITTTTPPPSELNNDLFVKLRLNAAKTEELLLRMDITRPPTAVTQLFS